MRKITITIISLLVTGALVSWWLPNEKAVGANLTEQEVLDAIATAQADFVSKNGKYFQGLRTDKPALKSEKPFYQAEGWGEFTPTLTSLPLETETHQYVTSKGEVGYQVFFYKTELGKDYVKSKGYGVEAASRTFDWRELNDRL